MILQGSIQQDCCIREMEKIRIGILGPSEIASRRFLPGIKKSEKFEFAGVAMASAEERGLDGSVVTVDQMKNSEEKAREMNVSFGGRFYTSYQELLSDPSVDGVYLPLPPGLHALWGKKALEAEKHILMEKPFTVTLEQTREILRFAEEKGLAVHENYAFVFHRQMRKIQELVEDGTIGELRLIRSAFGFPYRGETDFRYHRNQGGGALLDCGGYPIKVASYFLGETAEIKTSNLSSARKHDVDVFGSITMENGNGIVAQLAFGMDNAYKCELELWGSKGTIFAPRIFTPPAEMEPQLILKRGNAEETIFVKADDQFQNSAEHFCQCVEDEMIRKENYRIIEKQSALVDWVRSSHE